MLKKIIISGIPAAEEILHYELQGGFLVSSIEGLTITSFLTTSCDISETYIREKIKTIFHNGNPVDDPNCTRLQHGSIVAVSGAMPGLVGAMMRMGSPYAAMRESITDRSENIIETGHSIYVKLKLFNVILNDLWSGFLRKGVIFEKEKIIQLIKKIENLHGSVFSFRLDKFLTDSRDIEKFSDELYMIIIE